MYKQYNFVVGINKEKIRLSEVIKALEDLDYDIIECEDITDKD